MSACAEALQSLRAALETGDETARSRQAVVRSHTRIAPSISRDPSTAVAHPHIAVCVCLRAGSLCVQLALRKIVANVLDQPSELRFRRLRRSNSTLAIKVLPIPGVEQLLHAVGFEETSTNEREPVLFLSAASIDEPLLRQALSGLDQLIEALPPALAPTYVCPGGLSQTEAGTPVTLRGWDSRFRRPACVITTTPSGLCLQPGAAR